MAVTTTKTNKPLNPRGNDQSPKGYNRAALYSGKALDFDGVNDYVDGGTLDITDYTQMSVSFYMNVDTTTQDFRLISIRYSGADDIRIFHSVSIGGGVLNFSLDDGDVDNIGVNFETNQWYHVVMTHDGTTLKAYFNGVEQASTASTFDYANADGLFYVGRYTGGSVTFYDGEASNVKIFNTALTAAQVADLYNNPEKVVPTGVADSALKLWLPMMEGAGTTAYDGSGNGNHGTISGATWTHGIGAPVAQTAVIDWNKGVNVLLNSIDPSAGNWTTYTDTTLTGGQSDAIGGTNGFLFAWSTGAGQRAFYQTHSTDNGTYSLLLYAKAGTHDCFQILFANDGSNYVNFDLTNETTNVYAGGSSSIEAYGTDGWYKCEYTYTSTQATRVNIWAVDDVNAGRAANITSAGNINMAFPNKSQTAAVGPYIPTLSTAQTSPVLLPQGLTTGRDITGVNLFENVRKQGALNLDGNSWAEVHDNASLDFGSGSWTLEAWANVETTYTSKGIISRWYSASQGPMIWVFNGNFQVYQGQSSGGGSTSIATSIPSNGWHHIVGTFDSSDNFIRVYLNGVLKNTSGAITNPYGSNTLPLEIGRINDDASTTYPNDIAQPRIYNRALTAEEVERNYNAGKNIYK